MKIKIAMQLSYTVNSAIMKPFLGKINFKKFKEIAQKARNNTIINKLFPKFNSETSYTNTTES